MGYINVMSHVSIVHVEIRREWQSKERHLHIFLNSTSTRQVEKRKYEIERLLPHGT